VYGELLPGLVAKARSSASVSADSSEPVGEELAIEALSRKPRCSPPDRALHHQVALFALAVPKSVKLVEGPAKSSRGASTVARLVLVSVPCCPTIGAKSGVVGK